MAHFVNTAHSHAVQKRSFGGVPLLLSRYSHVHRGPVI